MDGRYNHSMCRITLIVFIMLQSSMAHSESWKNVSAILNDGLKSNLFPGAALMVGDEKLPLFEATVGDGSPKKIYDIASLTKVVATATSIMKLEERGELSLRDKISQYFPGFTGAQKDSLTLEDLMRHQAGLPSGERPFAEEGFHAYIKRITQMELAYKPRTKTVYSDLSFILLGRVVELVSGKSLAQFAQHEIFFPLKMISTDFSAASCAPTGAWAGCKVHDPTAQALLPAKVGNAGVFSSLQDLSRFARMMLNQGELDGARILKSETIKKMTTTSGSRGLGWDLTSEYATKPRGDVFPAGISYGHTGYTGTTLWIDPKSKTFYVFLSNRVYAGDERTRTAFGHFRAKLSSAIGSVIYHE